ncbi:hypothetical protein GCM10007276_28270 [Agaricicola taiwanensis]|uniref:Uncharacterized protein n=1 Tax=Agaricicola taiwanensis TaxID=591372 RepID=A0A8J2YKK5_9RHOB|nr:hypothetical protein [Agaricicola taiwanensis]GGE49464.1 hypothetical protein GCM10007276_28270 [Agaricicola taiwanensis]
MERFSQHRSATGALVFLLLGPLVWSIHFFIIYAAHASLCALTGGMGTVWITVIILAVTALGALALVSAALGPMPVYRLLVRHPGGDEETRFLIAGMRLLAGLSTLAIIWGGTAVLVLPLCAQLR